jgi:hypothetical protein
LAQHTKRHGTQKRSQRSTETRSTAPKTDAGTSSTQGSDSTADDHSGLESQSTATSTSDRSHSGSEAESTTGQASSQTRSKGASGGDETIVDPELAGSPPSQVASGSSSSQLITDPELAGTASSEPAAQASSSTSQPEAADVRLVLHSRVARDLFDADPREETWESTTIAALDATMRRSESLRFGIGFVVRYHFASLASAVPDAPAQRFDLDMIPKTGYIDATVARGLNVRLGYQPVQLGRFDVFSATNVLAVHDLREGPATLPDIGEVGQLAALCDFDIGGWLSLRAIYVPFFTPDLISVVESDYALFPMLQSDVNASFGAFGDVLSADEVRSLVASNLTRADRAHIAATGLSAFAPEPSFGHPQGALRATVHGGAGELALTFATALEHVPAFRFSDALLNPSGPQPASPDPHAIRIEYNRFAVIAVDGAVDVAPFSIGMELSYTLHRTLYAVGTGYIDPPYAVPIPQFGDLAQLGARIEYLQSTGLVFVLEAFGTYAVQLPPDPQRSWMFFYQQRYLGGAGTLLGYTTDFDLKLELSAAVFAGPSLLLTPRIAYALFPDFDVEVGALIVEGPRPPPFSTPHIAVGGVLDTVDHVFVGLRYRP